MPFSTFPPDVINSLWISAALRYWRGIMPQPDQVADHGDADGAAELESPDERAAVLGRVLTPPLQNDSLADG